jgi:hypothetical protein
LNYMGQYDKEGLIRKLELRKGERVPPFPLFSFMQE